MAFAKKELLIELINTLDSSEKRFFTRYANQTGAGKGDKFYRLFRHLGDGGSLEDPKLAQLLGLTGPTQLVNLQRHLYSRILDSLRLQHRRREPTIRVREQIDHASLLYDRGLYLHALKVLARAKALAYAYHLDLHHLLIIDIEKTIESRHITRASSARMTSLTTESRRRQEVMGNTVRQSNLQLTLQRHFILHGHVASAEEARRFYQLYHHYFSDPILPSATHKERILAHHCRFWYHYNQLQLERAGWHAERWTALIEPRHELREWEATEYIKGMDRRLLIAFFRHDAAQHRTLYRHLASFIAAAQSTQQQRNSKIMVDLILFRAELNQLLLEENAPHSPTAIREYAARIEGLTGVDGHKQLVLYYKLAALCVLHRHYNEALVHLQPILVQSSPLRYDLVVYSRLLQLWCHLKLGHKEFVGYGVNNLARYLGRIGYKSHYPTLILNLLRGLLRDDPMATQNFEARTEPLRDNVFTLREFRYLDLRRSMC